MSLFAYILHVIFCSKVLFDLGGAAGAVSRITGTVGKGLAALTLDDEYQQKRRQQMSQKPTNLGQGLAKGGKSFVKVGTFCYLEDSSSFWS